MNAVQLLAHYEQIADAPDAIVRLRRFVLNLAVRGKLVEQDPADEPASGLLNQVLAETEAPLDLPEKWLGVTVGSVLDFKYGKGKKASERLEEGSVPVFGSNGIVGFTDEPLADNPAIIIGRKGSAGALNLCDGPSWTTDVAYYVEAPRFYDLRYLFLTLQTLNLETLGKGVKPGLSRADAYPLLIGIPPLAEQHRIVAKVDELMALCDQLEAKRVQREATRDRLAAASLARLNAPDPDPAAFQNHAAFALDNLAPLTTRPDQIKALRQTILNLAVRGKLVDQNPNDEPAAELLKRIAGSAAHQPARRGKQRDTSAANALEELPFDSPSGWSFAALWQLVRVLNGRAYKQQELLSSGTPVLRVGNLFTSNHWYYSDLKLDDDKYCEAGDLIYAWSASFGPFIWDGPRSIFHYHIWKLPLTSEADLSKRYLFLFLQQKTREIKEAGHGISMVHMTKEKMEKLIVPLPPLAEQHRIVAKVEELMALCDRLEAALAAVDITRARLLEALLHEALTPGEDQEAA